MKIIIKPQKKDKDYIYKAIKINYSQKYLRMV